MDGARITVREIAERAGVSHSTVSRALRESPLVHPDTRRRLVGLAEELGYRPDPMLSALSAYRSRERLRARRDALAFVVGRHVGEAWRDIVASARERAERLGFDLQEYRWDESTSARRHAEILRARGVRGVVLGPVVRGALPEDLIPRFAAFAAVTIGRFVDGPRLDTVTPDHFGSVRVAVRELAARGHRRIGLALLDRLNVRTGDRLRTSFLGCRALAPQVELPEPLLVAEERFEIEAIASWIRTERPEALLSYGHVETPLRDAGIAIPADLSFASLNLNRSQRGHLAGVDVDDAMVGRVAVDLLHGKLLVGETGIPPVARTVVVDTRWHDGATVVDRSSPVSSPLGPSTPAQ